VRIQSIVLTLDLHIRAGLEDKPAVDIVESIYYSANYYTETAVKIIQEYGTAAENETLSGETDPSRLFLYFPIQNVHSPYQLPPAWETKPFPSFPFSTYAQMLHLLDTSVQNVTDAMVAANLWNETLMVFSADSKWGWGRGGGGGYTREVCSGCIGRVFPFSRARFGKVASGPLGKRSPSPNCCVGLD
jgi:hypothetical protein